MVSQKTILVLLFFLTMPLALGALSDNLVNYWDGDGTTCTLDREDGDANLTLQGSAGCVANGKIGQGFRVLGSDTHFINTTNTGAATGAGAGTICAWLNTSSVAAGSKTFWNYGTASDGQARGHQRDASALKSYRYVNDQTYTSVTLSANTYFYACDVYDGSKSLFYYNGANTNNYTTTLNTGNTNLYMGADKFFAGGGFNGTLDEFGVWTRALTAAEISELYNSGSGRDYSYITSGTALNVITVSLFNNVTNTQISSSVTFTNITGNLNFSFFNITTSGYCVTLTGNGTITNCTAGNGASTYFNTTKTQTITTTESVVTSTHQANLNITAYRLFLNTSITTFNGTNNQTTNQTTTTNLILKALNGTNNIRIDTPGNYSLNITCTVPTPLTTVACNATGIYDTLLKINATLNGAAVTTFTTDASNTSLGNDTRSTTNGSTYHPLIRDYTYYLTINASSAAVSNTTLTITTVQPNQTFTLLSSNTFNLSFYNESTGTILNNTNISVQLISDSYSNNYSTTNGTLSVPLLVPGDYTIRYWNNPDVPRDYYVSLTPQSFQTLSLYILDEEISNIYLPVIQDQSGRAVSDCTVKLLRYYVEPNGYIIVEMTKTDTNGQGVLRVVPNIINYKLIVTCSASSMTTTPQKYTASTNTFTINLQDNPLTGYFAYQEVTKTLTYNNATQTYVLTWSDDQNTVSGGCLYVAKTYQNGTKGLVNSECVGGASGSLIYTITDTNNTAYSATGQLNTTSEYSTHFLGPLIQTFREDWENFGLTGVLLSFFVIITVVFMSMGSTDRTVLAGAVGILIMTAFGFMAGTWTSTIGILILAVIIMYKTRSG